MARDSHRHPRGLEVLSEEECIRLLSSHSIGRVAVLVDGRPQIFPVNYAFDERVVVYRTAPGTKLNLSSYGDAAFEIDEYDPGSGVAWSVMVQGSSHNISAGIDSLSTRLRQLVVQPEAPGRRREWMAIYANEISGRRFQLGSGRR